MDQTKVGIIGAGKLGSAMMAAFLQCGVFVEAVDKDKRIVDSLNNSMAPFEETGVQEALLKYHGNYIAGTNISDITADMVFIVVATPSDYTGQFDNTQVFSVLEELRVMIMQRDEPTTIVIASTVMPESMIEFKAFIESGEGPKHGKDFVLVYNPEFIAQGNIVSDVLQPDYVLIGASRSEFSVKLRDFYKHILFVETPYEIPIRVVSWETAEITKLAQNVYITMKLAFANSIGRLCASVDNANARDVLEAMRHDRRISPSYFSAATPFGGPCFPRDSIAFNEYVIELGVPFFATPYALNQWYNDWLITWIANYASANGHDKILIAGMAFRNGTPLTTESFGLELNSTLKDLGYETTTFDRIVPTEAFTDEYDLAVLTLPDRSIAEMLIKTKKPFIDLWGLTTSGIYPFKKDG